MRAVAFQEFGGPDVLRLIDTPVPAPGPGQVRVRVAASPVNPVDVRARAGVFGSMLPARGLYVPGVEFAGHVDALGPEVSGFALGQPVIGLLPWLSDPVGSTAEYLVAAADALAAAPRGVDLVAAATLPLNGITADLVMRELGPLAGRTVLVTGAAGGVGGYAVQLAAAAGAHVLGMAGAGDEQLVLSLGATGFIPRDTGVDSIRAQGIDAVIDAAELGAEILPVVRDGGTFVAVLPPALPASERDITVTTVFQAPDGPRLTALVALVEAGTLTLRVAETLPFTEAATAHARFEKGGLRGRLVLVP
ncbi:NADP-dependent oxidoreductase [Nocardia sp. NBC_01388]|uniref:NADP-dependent oxidoreductase n=1 Tax=Nocardia sp. NBC_01388 TaxID=2903596 RepID=UPI0032475296